VNFVAQRLRAPPLRRSLLGHSAFLGLLISTFGLTSFCRGSVVYNTGFEQSEGYNMGFELIGQQGWIGVGTGGTDVYSQNNNQLGLIGFWSPTSDSETFTSVWRPINVTSIPSNALVRFSVQMTIIDSGNGSRDEFRWSAYNASSNRLFTLAFDNDFLDMYYILSDGSSFNVNAGTFRNGINYNLVISMDFPRNRWNATLSGLDLQINKPITVNGAPITLGDMDAVWLYHDPELPGDNYMLFDNYKVSLDVPPSLQISRRTNSVVVRLFGQNGDKYALDSNSTLLPNGWLPVTPTNTLTSGFFDTTNSLPSASGQRFYRGRLVQ
jgi:hypothetical protein